MKINKQRYEAPQAEIIEIESQGVLCASGSNAKANSTPQYNMSQVVIVV